MKQDYDLIIIGAGPAGFSAAIYGARYKLKVLLIGELIGGLITEAHKVCNVPSYKEISGFQLAEKMKEQAEAFDVEIQNDKVESFKKLQNCFEVKTYDKTYYGKKIILATGCKRKKLELKNEEDFIGKGVSYCALCDASFYNNKIVGVVGGGNTALASAMLLTKFAKKVYIIYRRDKFLKAEPILVEEVEKNEKIELILNSQIKELIGKEKLEKIKLDNGKEITLNGLFIDIGSIPRMHLAEEIGIRLENTYIKTDKKQRTNIKGVFAAGDITNNVIKQVVTAMAEGAIAANSAYEEIRDENI